MKKSPKNRSSENTALTRIEWDFDNVPDDELAACCLWEYARESESFAISSAEKAQLEELLAPEEEADSKLNSRYEAFLDSWWNCDHGYMQYYETIRYHGGPGSLPWQSIPQNLRYIFKNQVGVREIGGPFLPAMLGQLERLYKENVKEWEAARRQPRYDLREDAIGYETSRPNVEEPGHPGERHGESITAFAIDFRRYTDKEIGAVFADWLRANRPIGCPEPSRRGRKLRDLRVALDRLGIMRLLSNFTLREIPTSCPEAWKAFATFDWYKERQRACTTFRKLFPFLSCAERPLSWPTKGGRSR